MSCIYGRYKNRSPRVLHHVCLQPQIYTFWRLQHVNQFNWELPPPPPQTGLLHGMCTILAK